MKLYILLASSLFYLGLILIVWFCFRRIPKEPWSPPQQTNRLRYGWLLAVGIYSVLALLYFAPYLSRMGSMLIGPAEDNMQSYWNLWYGWEVLRGHYPSLLHCNVIAYPEGVSMVYHSYSYYNLLLSFALRHIGGPVLAYNLLLMHTFILGGLGAFFLGRYLLRDDYLALVVGFIFAFSPFHFARIPHHINIASLHFVPFFVLFYIRAIRGRKWTDMLLAALFLLLNALCSWVYLILGLYFIILAYIYLVVRRRCLLPWDVIGRTSAIVGVTFIALSPLLVPMIIAAMSQTGVYRYGHNDYVADVVGLLVPSFTHWLGRLPPIMSISQQFTGNPWESAVYLGLSTLLIVLLTIRHTMRESARYVLCLLGCLILAMGEWVHVLGQTIPVALPYRVLEHIPFFSNMRTPSRHVIYGYLFLGILVGIGLRYLCRTGRWTARAIVVFIILAAIMLVDYYSYDTTMTSVKCPPAYQAILQDGEGAIMDVPDGLFKRLAYTMLYQTSHERPIVSAYVSRKFEKTLGDYLNRDSVDVQLEQLAANHVRYIVIHKAMLDSAPSLDTSAYDSRCPRLYTDQSHIVYTVY